MNLENQFNTHSVGKMFVVIFFVFTCIHVCNFAIQRIYPFLDTPNHLALATIYSSYGLPDNRLDDYYALEMFPKPNVFYTVFCAAKIFPSVDFANKVFYVLYAVLFLGGIVLLIARCSGNQWYALLAFLLLYNINVCYGFTGFTIAVPTILFLLYLIINYIEKRSTLAAILIAVLLPGIFFMHAMAFLFAVMVYTACIFFDVYRRGSWHRILLDMALCIPGVMLCCFWFMHDSRDYSGPSMAASIVHYYQYSFLATLWQRGAVMIHDNFRLSGALPGYAAAAAFSGVIVSCAVFALLQKIRAQKKTNKTVGFYCGCIFLMCSVFCALFVPVALPGYSFLYQRFSVFVFLGIILVTSIIAPVGVPARMKIFLCAVIFFHSMAWFQYFRGFDEENAGFNKDFFMQCSSDDVLVGLIYEYRFRNVSVYNNFPDYYTAWTGGVSATRMVDDRSFIIKRKVGPDKLPEYLVWPGRSDADQYDGRYASVDYILVRGSLPVEVSEKIENFSLIKHAGAWRLYANRVKKHF